MTATDPRERNDEVQADGGDDLERHLIRMDDAFELIRRASAQGQDVTAWERQWIDLLAEYERMLDMMEPTSD